MEDSFVKNLGKPFYEKDGEKYWLSEDCFNYAKQKELKGDYRFYLAQAKDGYLSYLIVLGRDIVYASQKLEEIGTWIDLLVFEQESEKRKNTP